MNPPEQSAWDLRTRRDINPATGEALTASGAPLPPTMADVLAANDACDAADEVIARGNYTCEDLATAREAQATAIAIGDAYGRAQRAAKVST